MAADCIVTPRALSAGKKSVTVEPSSTSVEAVRIWTWEGSMIGSHFMTHACEEPCERKYGFKGYWGLKRKCHTSYSSGMPTIVEHALRGSRLALVYHKQCGQKVHLVTYRINVGNDANIPRSRDLC